MRIIYSAVCLLLFASLANFSFAQSTDPATAGTTGAGGSAAAPDSAALQEVLVSRFKKRWSASVDTSANTPLTIRGAVDAYYMSGKAPLPTSFTGGANNSFSLGMANLIFSKEGKVGFCADLAFGPRAEGANGGFDAEGNITTLTLIKQLYVTYSPFNALKLTLGNFSTYYGYELIDAPLNVNYSTSYLFSYGPFFHTGLKANVALSDKLGLMLGIFGDTDTKIDVVKGKHLGAQLSYASGNLAAYVNYLGGRFAEETEDTPEIMSNQFDLTASFQATEKLGLGFNAAVRNLTAPDDSDASWSGAALYAKYAFNDTFLFGLRAESINDKDGFLFGETDNNIFALTASGNITLGNLRLIPELRLDSAKATGTFTSYSDEALKATSVFLLAAVYSF
jgi:hypothetical protein